MTIEERVINVITREQHLDPGKCTMDSSFQELGIDSLDGVNIMFALEEEFTISIPDSIARQMKGVRQVVEDLTRFMEDPERFKAELVRTTMPLETVPEKPAGGVQ
ncbi:MAG: acyl carrier protein [Acidobacteriia bacterium]|nr:acyl carrier protein [Terriglobia bacterium]